MRPSTLFLVLWFHIAESKRVVQRPRTALSSSVGAAIPGSQHATPSRPVQVVRRQAEASTSTVHGLGLWEDPPIPTNDPNADPIDRSQIALSWDQPPIPAPGDNWASESDSDDELPRAVDWRNRWGVNWITSIQNQGACGSCWAFATTALIESMIRIQHGYWDKRSEGDLFESSQQSCNDGWDFEPALDFIQSHEHGISDTMCDIYYDRDRPFLACGDREGRALLLGNYTGLETMADTKWWIHNVGPVTCAIDVYTDFQRDYKGGVYHHNPKYTKLLGGHALLVVGYDDDKQCWIVKNSWGPDWGDHGYVEIGYGEVRIDDFQNNTKYGVTNLDPDQWPRRRHRNGNILQSASGILHRDLEVLRTSPEGNLTQVQRNGEGRKRWTAIEEFQAYNFSQGDTNSYEFSNGPVVGQPVFLETSFGRQRECVYWVEEKKTFAHWYYNTREGSWVQIPPGGVVVPPNEIDNVSDDDSDDDNRYGIVSGFPGFVENDDSNFTVVVKTEDESLTEYTRFSQVGPWVNTRQVTPSGVLQSGPSLVQSNVGLNLTKKNSGGNLYVAAVLKTGQLQLFWRGAYETSWHAGEIFGEDYDNTPPVMIQDWWNTQFEYSVGGFQLLIAKDGNVEHWQRVNDDIADHPPVEGEEGKWECVGSFGDGDIAHVWGLVQGSFNFALEAIVEDNDGDLWHWKYVGEWKRGKKLPDSKEDESEEKSYEGTSGESSGWGWPWSLR